MKALKSRAIALSLSISVAAAFPDGIASAAPQPYPSKTITLVVPFGAGGGIDTVARIVAQNLQNELHEPVVVENRAGAGGLLGASSVARAAPDGYTLLFMEASSVLAKWLHKNSQFDAIKDFTPIAMVATNHLALYASSSLPVNNLKELAAYSKANPGKLAAGTPGVGTPHHLAALMLNQLAGLDIRLVPYRGTPASVTDLIGGQIPLVWAVPLNVEPFVQQGKAKALGVSSPQRLPLLPQVPTIAEQVAPGFEVTLWLGIAAPANVPAEIVARLDKAVHEITEHTELRERFAELGYHVDFRNSKSFGQLIAADQERYGAIIHDAGIQPQ